MTSDTTTVCPHCEHRMPVRESMHGLLKQCPACETSFEVTTIDGLATDADDEASQERDWLSSAAVKPIAIAVGLLIAGLLIKFAVQAVPDVIARLAYGSETSELRGWYKQLEKGMPMSEALELLDDMPVKFKVPRGESLLSETVFVLGNDITDPPGTKAYLTTSEFEDASIEIKTFFDEIGGKFRERRLEIEFRIKPEEEIGKRRLSLRFELKRGMENPQLTRKSKSGF